MISRNTNVENASAVFAPKAKVNALQTQVDALPNSGLTLIKTQTLSSAVVYIDITNCFDANHTNYRVVISNLTAGSAQFIYFKLLNGSTPSNSSYNYQYFTAQGSVMNAGQSASASYGIIAVAGVTKNSAITDIMNPYSTEYTTTIMNANYDGNTNQGLIYQVNTTHTVSSSYNGLRIGSQAGNSISGATIRIYGYRDSI